MSNWLYLILGWIAVALGLVGVLLPVLPTTPFIILAAFLFGKGSPKARKWLIEHKIFGPIIQDWEQRGAIAPKIKVFSCSMMLTIILFSLWLGLKPWVLTVQIICISAAAIFVLTRPNE